MQNADPSRSWLTTIGIFKLIKALVLVVVGIGALKLAHQNSVEVLSRWVNAVHFDPDNKYFQKVLTKLWSVDDRKLKGVGAGTFFYAGLFLTEAWAWSSGKPGENISPLSSRAHSFPSRCI